MLKKEKQKLKQNKNIYLRLKIIPGASQTEIKEILTDHTIKISVIAPAKNGKANQALIKFLAQEFLVPKENIKIISGFSQHLKLIKIFL